MLSNSSLRFVAAAGVLSALVVCSAVCVEASPLKKKGPSVRIAQAQSSGKTSTKSDESDSTQLTGEQASSIILSPGLKSVSKKADVPEAVANLLPGFKGMAEPGGDFAAGCVGPGPHTRMIVAAIDGDKVIVGHESGGIAHWYKVEIFEQKGKDAKRIFSAFLGGGFDNLATLQDAVKKGALRAR